MDNYEKSTSHDFTQLGKKYWLSQTLPPLLMFGVLFLTENGTALVFLTGFLLLPVLFSFISIIAKFIRFKRRKYFMLRPFLTILNFSLIIGIAIWTYETALEQAIQAAEVLQKSCNENLVCPENPPDWIVSDGRISRSDLGIWFKYTASYTYRPEGFNIRVYHGPDVGHIIKGSIEDPVEVTTYKEEEFNNI